MWYLSQFDLEICHISGKLNNIADWLSRTCPYAEDHDEIIDEMAVPVPACTALALAPPSTVSGYAPPLPSADALRSAQKVAPLAETRLCSRSPDGFLYAVKSKRFH
eukprot:GHVH01014285.1.p1 GENE.GHVH01014285.1~~GHVH01014285.1.p1  ORF type:complete len:106 (-),score=8.81 GHVH01014285.1:701-1018(-)